MINFSQSNKNMGIGLMAIALILLCGCPVDTKYPLEQKKNGRIDHKLLGTWINDSTRNDVKKVKITLGEDQLYQVVVLDKSETYLSGSDTFRGWLTELDKHEFLVLELFKNGKYLDKYYLYHLSMNKKAIVTHDAAFKSGGLDAVVSTDAFKQEIRASMSHPEFLSDKCTWRLEK
jgi:hypothetical protein